MMTETVLKKALRKALNRESPEDVDRKQNSSILVVTRQPSSAGALSGWLEGAGYGVTVASSAAEAQALAGPFDCAVFDYQLGDESGIVLAAALSAEDKLQTVVFCPEPIAPEGAVSDDQATMEQLLEVELNVAAALAEAKSLQHAA